MCLSGVFNHALDDEVLEVNPVLGVVKRLQLSRDKHKEIEPLNKKEVQLFLEKCQQDRPEYYPFFMIAFRTGMRLGELLALQWRDVDWHGKFVRVNKSFKRGRITPTKNDCRHLWTSHSEQ
jgi:integrase